MSVYLGDEQRKEKEEEEDEKDENNPALDEEDIAILKRYDHYSKLIKACENDVRAKFKKVNELIGIKEFNTGLAPSAKWDLAADKKMIQNEKPFMVGHCTKILDADTNDRKYMVEIKYSAKLIVDLGDVVAPADIKEGMRVCVDMTKYQICLPLPQSFDKLVADMEVKKEPDRSSPLIGVSSQYLDDKTFEKIVGGYKKQIDSINEVIDKPLLMPERYINLGIQPPKGMLLFGPPGTGKTLCVRAVASKTDACFIRVIGANLLQKYVGDGARMVRELFKMARTKKACIIFFDEIDAIGGIRFDDGAGGDNEVQRTMLELINQLDGFDARGNIIVIMATNRPDTLDPALMRSGRLDRKIEFGLPDQEERNLIFKIHTEKMILKKDLRLGLIANLCSNFTGADISNVCREAAMFAIRDRKVRREVTEKDFLNAIKKVFKGSNLSTK